MSRSEECATLEAFGSTALVAVTDAARARHGGDRRRADRRRVRPGVLAVPRRLRAFGGQRGGGRAGAGRAGAARRRDGRAAGRAADRRRCRSDRRAGADLARLRPRLRVAGRRCGRRRSGARPAVAPVAAVPGWRTVDRRCGAEHDPRSPAGSASTSARPPRRWPPTARRRQASAVAGCGVLVSFGGDLAIAGPAPADGLAGPGDRRPPLRLRRARAVDLAPLRRPGHLEHRGPPLGDGVRGRASSDRSARPGGPPTACGGRPACAPAPAWTRTSPAPPRSSAARRRRRGSRRCGCRAGSCVPTARSVMSLDGRPKGTICRLGESGRRC